VETWDPPLGGVGPCVVVPGSSGGFSSESACNESTGQCPARRYFITGTINWSVRNLSTGVIESRSFTGAPNFATPSGGTPFLGPVGSPVLTEFNNTFFPFQSPYGFDLIINMGDGLYRYRRTAGNNSFALVSGSVTYSLTASPSNPSTPCT
jgi:hypothetical protein